MKTPVLLFITLAASTMMQAQSWGSDVDRAIRDASRQGKKVLLYFTLSEGCENCTKLDTVVFDSPEFREAADDYVLVKMDFAQNAADKVSDLQADRNLLLVERYNKDGFFPYVVVLGKDGKTLGKTGIYKDQSPRDFIQQLGVMGRRSYAAK